jgi:hypothetical protein
MESSSSLENALNPKPAVVPIPLLDILLMAISFFETYLNEGLMYYLPIFPINREHRIESIILDTD